MNFELAEEQRAEAVVGSRRVQKARIVHRPRFDEAVRRNRRMNVDARAVRRHRAVRRRRLSAVEKRASRAVESTEVAIDMDVCAAIGQLLDQDPIVIPPTVIGRRTGQQQMRRSSIHRQFAAPRSGEIAARNCVGVEAHGALRQMVNA